MNTIYIFLNTILYSSTAFQTNHFKNRPMRILVPLKRSLTLSRCSTRLTFLKYDSFSLDNISSMDSFLSSGTVEVFGITVRLHYQC